ncbi:MAG: ATP-binding protein [Pirellulales bacterium]
MTSELAQPPLPAESAAPSTPPQQLPAWYPAWARQLAELYFSGTTSLFTLHGNVHDLLACPGAQGDHYAGLSEFLATQVFGAWDVVLHYDVGRGLRVLPGADADRLKAMHDYLLPRWGEPTTWPRDPDQVLFLIDRLVERTLLEDAADRRKSIGIVFDHAQYLVPAGDLTTLAGGTASRLVRFLGWAQNPYLKRINVAFCLVADKLSEINDRLVQSPYVATIEVPIPDLASREHFARWATRDEPSTTVEKTDTRKGLAAAAEPTSLPAPAPAVANTSDAPLAKISQSTAAEAAQMANGLSLVSLNVVLAQAQRAGGRIDPQTFRQLKKSMIERQCQGLVEFVEPTHTLDLLVGQEAAKRRLAEDAACLARGQLDATPMGYLICGPVGTGKTFLAECYAGSVGIPVVKLRNFRSKYVGETEGNLELMLRVLRFLGPVVVIIDEADAALGSRQAEGDSGTSARVFAMIASQMGDTRYRGRIVWMLLTSRPDLLPIDLKRQGRAEVHIPLFYPQDDAERAEMFTVMARKNKVTLPEGPVPTLPAGLGFSGADIESVVLSAKRRARAAGRDALSDDDLEEAVQSFIPSVQGLEKEMQELAAVLECTDAEFLPTAWRQRVAQPNERTRLQERMVALRQLLSE